MRLAFGLCAIGLLSCAERDNPSDPVNRVPEVRITYPNLPQAGGHIRVVTQNITGRDPGSQYYGGIGSALAEMNPGDTLLIMAGTYETNSVIAVKYTGIRNLPSLIKSYGGEARIVARSGVKNILWIQNGYLRIEGLALIGATEAAVVARSESLFPIEGFIEIRSTRMDSCGAGIQFDNVAGGIVLRGVSAFDYTLAAPFAFIRCPLLDTAGGTSARQPAVP